MATIARRQPFREALRRAARLARRPQPGHGVQVLSPHEAWALYDAEARRHLGISAEEFERAWSRGDFRTRQEDLAVRRVAMIRARKPD